MLIPCAAIATALSATMITISRRTPYRSHAACLASARMLRRVASERLQGLRRRAALGGGGARIQQQESKLSAAAATATAAMRERPRTG